MDIHKNVCLALLGRERMVKMVLGGQTLEAVSEAVGVSQRTVRKWVGLCENEGLVGLEDDRCQYSERHRPSSPPSCADLPRRRRVSTPRNAALLRGKPISPNDADERYSNVPAALARSVSTLGQPLATPPHKPGRVVRPRMGHPPVRGRRIFKPLVGAGSLKFPLR